MQQVQFSAVDAARTEWNQATISLDFAGGTVEEYFAAVRRAAGETPVNVSFAGGVEQVQLPTVSFRGVQLETAIRTAAELHEPGPEVRMYVREVTPEVRGFPLPRVGTPLFVVGLESLKQRERESRVISLNGVIARGPEAMPAEVVLTAIEAALRNDGAGVDMKFHKDSGLLFVSGTDRQCDLAERVVGQLLNDADPLRGRSAKPETEQFALAHADPGTIIDALRLAFPTRPDQPPDVRFEPVPSTNSVVVSAPPRLLIAVRALIRYADVRPELNPMIAAERVARAEAMRRAEAAEREAEAMRLDTSRLRDESAKVREEAVSSTIMRKSLSDDLQRSRAQVEELRAALEAAREELAQIRRNQKTEPSAPR
ncbi:MAG: secretin N-terminal domain-containing protein [Phycisphaerales bacterium]